MHIENMDPRKIKDRDSRPPAILSPITDLTSLVMLSLYTQRDRDVISSYTISMPAVFPPYDVGQAKKL